MLKILVIDDSESMKRFLREKLEGRAILQTEGTESSVLESVRAFEPDIIVLDLSLRGQDALEVLLTVRGSGREPLVIATSDCNTPFIRARVQSAGVDMLLCRPFKQSVLLARLLDMIQFVDDAQTAWCGDADHVNDILFTLGVCLNKSGYPCIQSALLKLYMQPDISMTKELYPHVAQQCGGSAKRVERAIRCEIHRAWERRDKQVWKMYFPDGKHNVEKCPTNGAFLSRLAACMRKEKKIG